MTRDERLAEFYARRYLGFTEERLKELNPPPENANPDQERRYGKWLEDSVRKNNAIAATVREFVELHTPIVGDEVCFTILDYIFRSREEGQERRQALAQLLDITTVAEGGAAAWYVVLLVSELWAKLPIGREDYYPPILNESVGMLYDQ